MIDVIPSLLRKGVMTMTEILKIVHKDKKYKAKNGKEYSEVNYYIRFNGNLICIRPAFSKDYSKLDMIAQTIVNGKSE